MSETKRDVSGVLFLLLMMVALLGGGTFLGSCGAARRFERQGYVLIQGIDGEAVATVTPVFEEWRR